METTRTVFVVIDAAGNEWARYCYAPMAEEVAARCNADAALAACAPFTVAPLEA